MGPTCYSWLFKPSSLFLLPFSLSTFVGTGTLQVPHHPLTFVIRKEKSKDVFENGTVRPGMGLFLVVSVHVVSWVCFDLNSRVVLQGDQGVRVILLDRMCVTEIERSSRFRLSWVVWVIGSTTTRWSIGSQQTTTFFSRKYNNHCICTHVIVNLLPSLGWPPLDSSPSY